MMFLLDTHTFLWWDQARSRLSKTALELLENPANLFYLSVASVWEIQIKHQLGKLIMNIDLQSLIASQQTTNDIQLLPIKPEHVYTIYKLDFHHRDPFDRLLIAQAVAKHLTLVTADSHFAPYPVSTVW